MGGKVNKETAIGLGWFLLWILIGSVSLWLHNLVLPYIYVAFAAAIYFAHLYLSCTRCCYFGKECYLLGGILSPKFFKERAETPLDPDDSISSALWFSLGVFPVPFLLYYQDFIWAIIYSAAAYGWFYWRKNYICKKCESGWCPEKK